MKSYSHFFSKNTCELDIVLTRAVNILTTNEFVKLTVLWTTGPRFFKITKKTFGKKCIYLLRAHFKKRKAKDLLDDVYAIFFLVFFIKAYVMGTHLNCIDKLMGTHNICLYKEVDKKYTGCNLKTTELFDCTLTGVCAVIRLKMVRFHRERRNIFI